MTYDVVSAAWSKGGYWARSCDGLTRAGRRNKNKKILGVWHRDGYEHLCIDPNVGPNGEDTSNTIKYKQDDDSTHHPCKGLGTSSFLGGGTDADGDWRGYTGKSDNYNNASFAFKCTIPDSRVSQNIKAWSISPHMTTAGAKGDTGFKNLWEQIIFGMDNPHVNQSGFCSKIENLNKEVHSDGRTCRNMISSALEKALGKQFCKNNPSDERCACINISEYGTAGCLERPNLPGCKELKAGFDSFPGNAQTEIPIKLWTPLCFMSDPCPRGNQFKPDVQQEACKQTIAICKQEQNLYADTVQKGAKISFKSDMECKAESSQAPSSTTIPPPPPPPSDDEEIKFPKSIDEFKQFFPKNVDELKDSKKKKIGVGAVVAIIVVILMCILLLLVAATSSSNSGPIVPVKRRFR